MKYEELRNGEWNAYMNIRRAIWLMYKIFGVNDATYRGDEPTTLFVREFFGGNDER